MEQKKTDFKYIYLFLLILCLSTAILSGCTSSKTSGSLYLIDPQDTYSQLVLSHQSNDPIISPDSGRYANPYSTAKAGHLVQCRDIQVYEALTLHSEFQFYPQILETVVFAIDSEKTNERPMRWADLKNSSVPISAWLPKSIDDRFFLGAAAYGLDGSNYGTQTVSSYFCELASNGHFKDNDPSCPIQICMDTYAVEQIRQGRSLEIIVPQDGTFSYSRGIFSNHPVSLPSERELLDAGYRLVNGKCENPLYPSAESYRTASQIKDYHHFNQITKDATRILRRKILKSHVYTSADGREHVLLFIFAIVIIISWSASAFYRCGRKDIRNLTALISFQMITWLFLSLFKYQLYTASQLSRFLWYAYYIFFLGLPFTLLCIATAIDHPIEKGLFHKKLLPVFAIYISLIILVFTNDWHQLVFRFKQPDVLDSDYTYQIGYFVIFAFCVLCFLTALITMCIKSIKSPKRFAIILPIFTAIALITYNIAYILGVPLFRNTKTTIMFCIFSMLTVEAIIQMGVLPTNVRYRQLFSQSPLSMQLVDCKGRDALKASRANDLTDEQKQQLLALPNHTLQLDERTLLHSRRIHGGMIVWQEDLSLLNALHEKMAATSSHLQTANQLLYREHEIHRKKISSEIKIHLVDELEQDIKDETEELSNVIQSLSISDKNQESDAYIPLLLCHIKRHCNLFFLSQESKNMSCNELTVYLDELSEFAAYAGIHALVRCGLSGMINIKTASLCYDFYFSMLSWSLHESHAILIGQIDIKEHILTFGILSSEDTSTLNLSSRFKKEIKKQNGSITQRKVDDSAGIYLTFNLKGGPKNDAALSTAL